MSVIKRGRPKKWYPKQFPVRGITIPNGTLTLTLISNAPGVDPRRDAFRIMAEHKAECKKAGVPYRRDNGIKKAAKSLGIKDWHSLKNYVDRSKRIRDS